MTHVHRTARGLLCMLALGASIAACDDDPSGTDLAALGVTVLRDDPTDSIIGRQEAIRVRFSGPVDTRTALDPENFIVIDRCTGLRVPGSLRLTGDTLIFTPSRALQFLTPLDIRVQNVLGLDGQQALAAPFTFSLVTEPPPIEDISWAELNSPTNDGISGVSFFDSQLGYISTFGGAIYRTINGGLNYEALFKDPDLIVTTGIRTAGTDTLFMTASPSLGGTTFTTSGLFRSVDGGRSFQSVFLESPADMSAPSVLTRPGARPVVLIGGNRNTLSAWRVDTQNDSIYRFGPVPNEIGYRAKISSDGIHAALAGENFEIGDGPSVGALYRSTTGGRTWSKIPLPAGSFSIRDVEFRTGSQGFAVGARSGVYRFDAATGTATRLGAANGIPQTDSSATSITTYRFQAIDFVTPDSGWIVGTVLRSTVGQPNVARGVILQTADGGQTWTRQAVAGTPDNGLGFDPLYDVFAVQSSFAVTGGESGFIALRTAATSGVAGVCSFADEPRISSTSTHAQD